ncbi:hypothetical protein LX32DRAFT_267301 [Colletotrichum zoysiae]|uniref:Uncharacterized protein n=1 Tax=Colletotrichum zoysiae TaxID=1216348 RepID=A0AAD9HM39_9PEZI|nr:hypothetical protein LX32DRAFT_267301 [Colletotrichum zoysiae]
MRWPRFARQLSNWYFSDDADSWGLVSWTSWLVNVASGKVVRFPGMLGLKRGRGPSMAEEARNGDPWMTIPSPQPAVKSSQNLQTETEHQNKVMGNISKKQQQQKRNREKKKSGEKEGKKMQDALVTSGN